MCEQPRSGAAAGDRVVGGRRGHHRVANPARQSLADMPEDLEPARHVIEGLADLVGDLAQRAAATGTGARCGMPQILSGQVLRQPPPCRFLRLGRRLDCCGYRQRCRCEPFRLVGLQRLERQLELLGVARQLLRGTAKLGPPITMPSPPTSSPATPCTSTTPRCRSWRRAPARPRPGGCGPTSAMSGLLPVPGRRRPCSSTRPTARANIRRPI
jgi:hypothetical protein